jgi:hypothetical protein
MCWDPNSSPAPQSPDESAMPIQKHDGTWAVRCLPCSERDCSFARLESLSLDEMSAQRAADLHNSVFHEAQCP